jgi:cell division protein FtsW
MPKSEQKSLETVKKPFDFILFITVMVLLSIGIVMVLSASSPQALAEDGNSYSYVKKQATLAILGIVAMLVISKIDYKIYAKFSKLAYIVSIILLASVPIIGSSTKGAKRWIDLGFTNFQPSEVAKIALIIFFAAWLTIHKDELKNVFKGFIYPFLYLLPVAIILIFFQNHLSVTILIIFVTSIMMLMAGSKLSHFLTFGTIGATVGGIGLFVMAKVFEKGSFRLARITTFLDPWKDIKGEGWQIVQSLYAIGSGGLFGAGLGGSKQKYLYIPEPHTDFIFSVLAEELGFIGCAFVIILFAIFVWRGLLVAMRAPDMFGSLVAVGITSLIALQAIMNIAVVTSSMPNTGIPLPFFTYGGTSLVILLCSVRCTIKYIKTITKSIKLGVSTLFTPIFKKEDFI